MITSTKTAKEQAKVAKIVDAMEHFDIASSTAWADLDALSSHTFLDGVEIDPDGIIIEGKNFKGSLSVYVLLKYNEKGDEAFETSDAFTGEFTGHLDDADNPKIDTVSIDTSPFYESL